MLRVKGRQRVFPLSALVNSVSEQYFSRGLILRSEHKRRCAIEVCGRLPVRRCLLAKLVHSIIIRRWTQMDAQDDLHLESFKLFSLLWAARR